MSSVSSHRIVQPATTNSPQVNDKIQTQTLQSVFCGIYYQNVCGLRTKSKQFFSNSSLFSHSIVVLTETWLNNSHFSSEFFDNSYHVYRKDRFETGSLLSRGGGVLVAIKSILTSINIILENSNHLEYVCVKVALNTKLNVFIYAAYIPPNSQSDIFSSHLSAINLIPLNPLDTLIIMGDFNLPHVSWIMDDAEHNILVPTCVSPQHAADFIDGIISNGVYQINSIRNASNKLLDLIFSNDFMNVEVATTFISYRRTISSTNIIVIRVAHDQL